MNVCVLCELGVHVCRCTPYVCVCTHIHIYISCMIQDCVSCECVTGHVCLPAGLLGRLLPYLPAPSARPGLGWAGETCFLPTPPWAEPHSSVQRPRARATGLASLPCRPGLPWLGCAPAAPVRPLSVPALSGKESEGAAGGGDVGAAIVPGGEGKSREGEGRGLPGPAGEVGLLGGGAGAGEGVGSRPCPPSLPQAGGVRSRDAVRSKQPGEGAGPRAGGRGAGASMAPALAPVPGLAALRPGKFSPS